MEVKIVPARAVPKARRQESVRFIVKWTDGSTVQFRAYKRDLPAVRFQEYLIEKLEIDPADIRVIMVR